MPDEIQEERLQVPIATILGTSDSSWRLKAPNLRVSELFSRVHTLSDDQQNALLQANARELGDVIIRLHLATETDVDVGSEVFALEDFVTVLKSAQDHIHREAERKNRRLVPKSGDGVAVREKWYQRSLVQAAIATGVFALLAALLTGIFGLVKEPTQTDSPTARLTKDSETENLRRELHEVQQRFAVFWSGVRGAASVASKRQSSPEDQSFAEVIMQMVDQEDPTTTKNMTGSEKVDP